MFVTDVMATKSTFETGNRVVRILASEHRGTYLLKL